MPSVIEGKRVGPFMGVQMDTVVTKTCTIGEVPRKERKGMSTMDMTSRVGPFVGVSMDQIVKHGKRRFRIILCGGYSAFGLIGSEINNVAVLDEDSKCVLLDGECGISSGYYGASEEQHKRFKEVVEMKWPEFRKFVNGHPRKRMEI